MYLILGVTGQLGQEIYNKYPSSIGLKHSHISITDPDVIDAVCELKPKVIFNCAAYHVVGDCEINPDEAFKVNALGPRNLAIAAKKIGAKLVHFSTDYVFKGEKGSPYKETVLPSPTNTYGITKLAGEHFVASHCDNYIIARVSALFGKYKCKAKKYNFPQMMIEKSKDGHVTVVDDQTVTPTYTYNLVQQIDHMIEKDMRGLFHVTNNTAVTWYDFTVMIMEKLGLKIDIVPTETLASTVKRPMYSALKNDKLINRGADKMWNLDKALEHYLNGIHKEISSTSK